jgi:hypothetical protein
MVAQNDTARPGTPPSPAPRAARTPRRAGARPAPGAVSVATPRSHFPFHGRGESGWPRKSRGARRSGRTGDGRRGQAATTPLGRGRAGAERGETPEMPRGAAGQALTEAPCRARRDPGDAQRRRRPGRGSPGWNRLRIGWTTSLSRINPNPSQRPKSLFFVSSAWAAFSAQPW